MSRIWTCDVCGSPAVEHWNGTDYCGKCWVAKIHRNDPIPRQCGRCGLFEGYALRCPPYGEHEHQWKERRLERDLGR